MSTYLDADSKHTVEKFKNKLADPVTKEKAEYYYPKIQRLLQGTQALMNYIDTLKQRIERQTVSDSVNKVKNSESINEILIANNQYKELYKRLKLYREEVLQPDSMHLGELRNYLIVISKEQDAVTSEGFLKQCFENASMLETITYLNRLKNNIAIVEMRCMRFYNDHVRDHIDWFHSYEAIVAQNARILKVGDSLEISGGVGAFSKERLLAFLVNGVHIEPNEKGIAVCKLKTATKTGSHSVPVQICLLDEDSIKQTLNFTVEYSLVKAIRKH